MRITRFDLLPDAAQRADWARILDCDQSTIYRADLNGRLKSSKPGGRITIYAKREILRWLGLETAAGEATRPHQEEEKPLPASQWRPKRRQK